MHSIARHHGQQPRKDRRQTEDPEEERFVTRESHSLATKRHKNTKCKNRTTRRRSTTKAKNIFVFLCLKLSLCTSRSRGPARASRDSRRTRRASRWRARSPASALNNWSGKLPG